MTPATWRIAGWAALILVLMAGSGAGAWQVQDWRYGKRLSDQALAHESILGTLSNAAATQARAEQDKRLALEQRLADSDQLHYRELSDAQKNQTRLRDRLATADLRLSVLLDTTDSASGCAVPADPGAGGVVHGGARARLDPAHAQRIISITDAGDQGLIALRACQAYVNAITAPSSP